MEESKILSLFKNGNYPHAVLLNSGANLDDLVNKIAQIVLCIGENPPCNNCQCCKLMQADNHPDYVVVQGIEDKGIKIAAIRHVIATVNLATHYQKRVVYFKDAGMMMPQAQNALLKTLEEPPDNTLFILAGNSFGLLVTILSRCMLINIGITAGAQIDEDAKACVNQMLEGKIQKQSDFYGSFLGKNTKRAQLETVFELQADYFLTLARNNPKKAGSYAACAKALIFAVRSVKANANAALAVDVLLISIASALKSK